MLSDTVLLYLKGICIILFTADYIKFYKTSFIKNLFLFFISFLIFYANKSGLINHFFEILISLFIFIFMYIFVWFISLKLFKKNIGIRLKFIHSFLELILILSFIFFGTNELTLKILGIGMFDVIFQMSVLVCIMHLSKKFNMLLPERK